MIDRSIQGELNRATDTLNTRTRDLVRYLANCYLSTLELSNVNKILGVN
jgi:hypothetical protein